MRAENCEPRHRHNTPAISHRNEEGRVQLADFLSLLTFAQFLNFAFIDEFFVYAQRKVNTKNDIIWTDNPNDPAVQEMLNNRKFRNPACVGVCVMMSAKTISFIIKEQGQSWDGAYFRDTVIPHLETFIDDEDNFYDNTLACVVHDRCPGWRANATQTLLDDLQIDHIRCDESYGCWIGNSADLNVIENYGSILMSDVELELMKEPIRSQNQKTTIIKVLRRVLRRHKNSKQDTFKSLVLSFPKRLEMIKQNKGKPLKY